MKQKLIIFLLFALTIPAKGQISTMFSTTGQIKDLFNVKDFGGFLLEFQCLKHQSASIGFGTVPIATMCDYYGQGLVFNNEFVFNNENGNFMYSPQLSAFFIPTLFTYTGIKLAYYTDFKNGGSLQFVPEVGLGIVQFFVVYSYNIPLINNGLLPVNKHNITLKLFIRKFR